MLLTKFNHVQEELEIYILQNVKNIDTSILESILESVLH
jgi:restriction endonuclease Mrr